MFTRQVIRVAQTKLMGMSGSKDTLARILGGREPKEALSQRMILIISLKITPLRKILSKIQKGSLLITRVDQKDPALAIFRIDDVRVG